jgi:hypothetical protein
MNAGGFMARVRAMLRQRRRNPTEWFSLPFPIPYQVLGGEAKALAPVELLDQGISMLLNAIGVPFELYKGNLSVQAAPAALRLFETSWTHLVHGLNEFLQELVDQVSLALNWESVPVKLLSPKITDDINDQMAKLQLHRLGTAGFRRSHIRLVLNRLSRRVELAPAEIERALDMEIYATLPNDYGALDRAYTEGRLLPENNHLRQAIGRMIHTLADLDAPGEGKRRFSLFNF